MRLPRLWDGLAPKAWLWRRCYSPNTRVFALASLDSRRLASFPPWPGVRFSCAMPHKCSDLCAREYFVRAHAPCWPSRALLQFSQGGSPLCLFARCRGVKALPGDAHFFQPSSGLHRPGGRTRKRVFQGSNFVGVLIHEVDRAGLLGGMVAGPSARHQKAARSEAKRLCSPPQPKRVPRKALRKSRWPTSSSHDCMRARSEGLHWARQRGGPMVSTEGRPHERVVRSGASVSRLAESCSSESR